MTPEDDLLREAAIYDAYTDWVARTPKQAESSWGAKTFAAGYRQALATRLQPAAHQPAAPAWGVTRKIRTGPDASNPNNLRLFVNGVQWAKVYGFSPDEAAERAAIIAAVLAAPRLDLEAVARVVDQKTIDWARNAVDRHAKFFPASPQTLEDVVRNSSYEKPLSEALAKARAIIAMTPPAGWQPIETAPDDGSDFFAICASAYTPTPFETWWADDFYGKGWHLYSRPGEKEAGGVHCWFPTHWMPKTALPTPSAAETEGS